MDGLPRAPRLRSWTAGRAELQSTPAPARAAGRGRLPPPRPTPPSAARKQIANQLTGTLPAAWGSNGSFSGLYHLVLEGNQVGAGRAGGCRGGHVGVAAGRGLWERRRVGSPGGYISGPSYSRNASWMLKLPGVGARLPTGDRPQLSGTLPASWGAPGAFPRLASLGLAGNSLMGSLPPGWGDNGSLPQLEAL